MNQAEINAAIVAAIDNDALKALQDYKAAAEEVRTGGARQGDSDIVAKNLA